MATKCSPELKKVIDVVKNTPLFSSFGEAFITVFLQESSIYQYAKNEIIYLDEIPKLYIVLSGGIKLIDTSHEGVLRVLTHKYKGDYFGELGVLNGGEDNLIAVPYIKSLLLVVTKEVFSHFLLQENKTLKLIIQVLCERLKTERTIQTILSLSGVESKLRSFLLYYSELRGIKDGRGVIINTQLTHLMISEILLLSREAVSRKLMDFRNRGEIELTGDKLIRLLPLFFERSNGVTI